MSEEPIFIDNIIIEPKSTSQQFVIYGSYDNSTEEGNELAYDVRKSGGDDVMITLDFSGLHAPACKGVDNPGKDGSDFELWSPHDDGRHGSTDKCFLGQQVTYIRRKQDSECFNGEDFERQTMRVPCLCTNADYECDMNYIKNKGGDCELMADPLGRNGEKVTQEKEEDCALEGFYYVTQGYRKIPGDMCYGGIQKDPIKKPCTSMAWVTSIFNQKTIFVSALLAGILYYGWPIIEAILLVLPIPDPKDSISRVKSAASAAGGMVNSAMSSNRGPHQNTHRHAEYSSNLDAQPEAFIEDDDNSDDDVGKPMNSGLNYDSDDKNDEELVVGASTAQSELIDLSGGSSSGSGEQRKAAAKIPKLSKP